MDKDSLRIRAADELSAYINNHFYGGNNLYAPTVNITKVKTKKPRSIVLKIEFEICE